MNSSEEDREASGLSVNHKRILSALLSLYEKLGRPVKVRELTSRVGLNVNTVRSMLVSLRGRGLVASKPGPRGGYIPTSRAYELFKPRDRLEVDVVVEIIRKEGLIHEEELKNVNISVEGILSEGKVRARLDPPRTLSIKEGDKIIVRGTNGAYVVISGVVEHVDPKGSILVGVDKILLMPSERLRSIIGTRKLVTIEAEASLRDAARLLFTRGIRGAPVVDKQGKIVGVITTTDIAKLIAMGRSLDEKVGKFMRRPVFSVSEDDSLLDALRLMKLYGVGRLLVLDVSGKPVGIITRSDIVNYLMTLGLEPP